MLRLYWTLYAVFAFLYLPIVTLIVYSFNRGGVGEFPPRNLTLGWCRALFADDAIWTSVLNSLLVALAAMAISLALGIPAALALDRANFPGKSLFRRLMLLPLILPGIITGLSMLLLFREANLNLSLHTIILGHGTALISVATTEVFAGLQKLDRAQEEASLDLGANYWQTLFAWVKSRSAFFSSAATILSRLKSGAAYAAASLPRSMRFPPSSFSFRSAPSWSGIVCGPRLSVPLKSPLNS
jgi:ABC-type spermidine/putrescine transport system permease subunit II